MSCFASLEDRRDVRVGQDQLQALDDLLGGRAAAIYEKIGIAKPRIPARADEVLPAADELTED